MKFSISSTQLLAQLQIAGGVIGSNPVIPILEDFLFSIQDNKLTIIATDLETTITTEVEVLSDSDGMIAIPARILLDTLKALPQQPITININEETYAIEITSAYGKYKLSGENGLDYPEIPTLEVSENIKVETPLLTQGIVQTLFATSSDELRPAMTGVYFQVDPSSLTLVATDAHKLVKYAINTLSNELSTAFIIPKKALNLLKNALPEEGSVQVAFNKKNAFFTFDDKQIICRLIDARYPDYNAVIPINNPNEMIVNRSDFQSSLKRIVIYANKTTNQVILNIQDGSLTISAEDLDFSNAATEQLTCTYSGDPITIGFNAKFLLEMLNVLDAKEVKINLADSSRAGILTPVEKVEDIEMLMVMMPIMLNH